MKTSFPAFASRLRGATLLKLLAVVVASTFLAGLSGCVSADDHKRLQTAFDESQRQLADAENDINTLRRQITELNSTIASLRDAIAKSAGGMSALDALQARLADLQAKYDDLLKTSSQPALPVGITSMLRDLAAQYPDYMEFDERTGMIRLKSDLTFDKGSTEVSAKGKQVLARLAQILNRSEIERHEIQVSGHTDDIPITGGGPLSQRNPDNWTLSTNRAWSVLAVLRENGVKQDRGMAAGWGDQRPVAANAPGRSGNVLNRRVEIYIRATLVPDGIVVSTPSAAVPPRGSVRPASTTTPPVSAAAGVPRPM